MEQDDKNNDFNFIKLAYDVANHYKQTLCKSKIGIENSWVIVQKLAESTYNQATNSGFDGDLLSWIDLIGACLKHDKPN